MCAKGVSIGVPHLGGMGANELPAQREWRAGASPAPTARCGRTRLYYFPARVVQGQAQPYGEMWENSPNLPGLEEFTHFVIVVAIFFLEKKRHDAPRLKMLSLS